ncbi:kinase-like domain-containing protein, partial [Favolaschia claudopus]
FSDFGLSTITNTITILFTHSTAAIQGGTVRYQAPELFREENPCHTHFGSDIYAFALVCYEKLTGKIPFHELCNDITVMMKVARGHRPSQPPTLAGTPPLDHLWLLMGRCWQEAVEGRPNASQVVSLLVHPLIGAPLSLTDDRTNRLTSKFRRSVQVDPLLPSIGRLERILFGGGMLAYVHR